MAERLYDPTVYYHRDGRQEVVTTREQEHLLLQDSGWSDTPATHGVVSAPSVEERAKMPHVLQASMPGPQSTPGEQMAFSHILLQWQNKLDEMRDLVTASQADYARLEAQHLALQARLMEVTDRVSKTEQTLVVAQGRDVSADLGALRDRVAHLEALRVGPVPQPPQPPEPSIIAPADDIPPKASSMPPRERR